MRWVKPLDAERILQLSKQVKLLISLEEHAIAGGAGAAVSELLAGENVLIPMLHLGIRDSYIEHGSPAEMLADCGLDDVGIYRAIYDRLRVIGAINT